MARISGGSTIGNLDGNSLTEDDPAWQLPDATTKNGGRTSIIRKYDNNTVKPLLGTVASSWVASTEETPGIKTFYGDPSDVSTPGYIRGGVLPVTLSSFRAEHTDAGVVLKWTTESEIDNAGFYIYRSETRKGETNSRCWHHG